LGFVRLNSSGLVVSGLTIVVFSIGLKISLFNGRALNWPFALISSKASSSLVKAAGLLYDTSFSRLTFAAFRNFPGDFNACVGCGVDKSSLLGVFYANLNS
jgi:hypothetical protein